MNETTPLAESPLTQDQILTQGQTLPSFGKSFGWLLIFAVMYLVGTIVYFIFYGAFIGFQNPNLVSAPEFESIVSQRIEQHGNSPSGVTGMYIVQFVFLMPVLLAASHFKNQSWKQTLGFNRFSLKALGICIAMLAGLYILQIPVDSILEIESSEFLDSITNSKHHGLAIMMILAAPLLEESLFRGYLFKAWRPTKLGLTGTLLVTSVLFTSLHLGQYHWIQMGYLFLLSVILGLAREYSGSIWPPIIMHGLNNAIAVIFLVYLGIQ